jgi:hypothetical protein
MSRNERIFVFFGIACGLLHHDGPWFQLGDFVMSLGFFVAGMYWLLMPLLSADRSKSP